MSEAAHDPGRSELLRYVPKRVAEWDLDAPGRSWQRIDGALCFVDISGFTALTEKLARRGRIGAEELTEVLDHVFGSMLRLARDRGGSLVKFGGDALLLMFEGADAGEQAVSAAIEMRTALSDASGMQTSVGAISLRMSVGVHAGPIELYRAGESHTEVVIVGPTAALTVQLESAADAGEILVSPQLAAQLPAGAAGDRKGPGLLLRWRRPRIPAPGPVTRRPVDFETIAAAIPGALRERLSERAFDSEHRMATVGFVKYSGIHRVLDEFGPDELADRLDEFMRIVQREVDAEDLTFLNADTDVDGGKVTMISGVPVHREDAEGRLLRASRRIIDSHPRLPISAGVSRGALFSTHVGTEDRSVYTVMGDAINLAARLTTAAPYGSIYLSPDVAERSRTVFDLTELEPMRVKGKTVPVRVVELGVERGSRPDPTDTDLPFVGRADGLESLRDAVEGLDRGRGAVIGVSGGAGSGKTRLLREGLAAVASPHLLVLRAEPFAQDNPYWVFRDPLRRLLGVERGTPEQMVASLTRRLRRQAPDLVESAPLLGDLTQIPIPDTDHTATIEPRYRPARIADTFIELLDRLFPDRLVLVVEDGHWIDDASVAVVETLIQAASDRPWLVVISSRSSLDDGSIPFDELISLDPLTDEEARALVIAGTEAMPLLPHELDSVVGRGTGSPLFLTELIRRLRTSGEVGDLPESLEALVGSGIDRLDTGPRQVLRYASVLGRSFREVVLLDLLGPDGFEIGPVESEALEPYLESEGDDRLRFRSAIIRDVAYGSISYRRRRALHARAVEVIARLAGDPESEAEFLAMHSALAGDSAGAWEYSVIAGDKARESYSNVEAATQYRRAIDAAARLDVSTDELVDVWSSLADALEDSGALDDARAAIGSALRLVSGDPVARADLHLRRARTWMMGGSFANAKRNITLGRRGLDPSVVERHRGAVARLDSLAAGIAMYEGRPRQALESAEEAMAQAKEAGDDDALARAYIAVDWAYHMLGQPEQATHGEQALALLQGLGKLKRASDVMNNEGGYAYFAGRWDEAVSWYRRSQEASERAGNVIDAAFVRANIAEVMIGQRQFEEAATELEESHRVLRAAGALPYLGFVELQMARLDIETGRATQAVDRLEEMYNSLVASGDRVASLEIAVHLADARVRCGDPDGALEVLEVTSSRAGDRSAVFAAAMSRVRSQALWERGDRRAARVEATTGLELAQDAGMPFEEALLLEWIETMDVDSGDTPKPTVVARRLELERMLGLRPRSRSADSLSRS